RQAKSWGSVKSLRLKRWPYFGNVLCPISSATAATLLGDLLAVLIPPTSAIQGRFLQRRSEVFFWRVTMYTTDRTARLLLVAVWICLSRERIFKGGQRCAQESAAVPALGVDFVS